MSLPIVSVIIPVFNVEDYLRQSLDSLVRQKEKRFEIICVDDCSDDQSLSILQEYEKKDKRFRVIRSEKRLGAGAARNRGFQYARGKYTIFLDADDLFDPRLLEKSVRKAEESEAQIVAFNYTSFDDEGYLEQGKGIHLEWLPAGVSVFNYRDCPDYIMNVISPTPWTKLYRTDFIRDNHLAFEEISSTNDVTFSAVSVAMAERICFIQDSLVNYRVSHGGTITSTKSKNLKNVQTAVLSAVEQVKALPYFNEIQKAAVRFAVNSFVYTLRNYVKDIESDVSRKYYEFIHEYFKQEIFDECTAESLHSDMLYAYLCCFREIGYAEYAERSAKKVTVSMTSFPKRIGHVVQILNNLSEQTKKPDTVLLWLAESQFPDKKLPEELLLAQQNGTLRIRWCDDLRPHKKYFYALQEQKEDELVITVDDDIVYPKSLIESLHLSYIRFPKAVSSARVHLILIDENKNILPYQYWIRNTSLLIGTPSMQFLATTGAGCLYPPDIFPKELFDKEAILENCLNADDLWVKAMELIVDVPVVLACFYKLKYYPDTQTDRLFNQNKEGGNDEQLHLIMNWIDNKYGCGFFISHLMDSRHGVAQTSLLDVMKHVEHQTEETAERRKAIHLRQKEKNQRLESEIKMLKNSASYRIGSLITWLPRKIRNGVRRMKSL